ncbi:MAG: PTS glucitol/sorbitol transporter subunit IIA [Lachnospiraceae bacterium]
MKYQSTIVGWGADALGFLEIEDCNFIVIFNENAPEELVEISILHTIAELGADPAVGDTVRICGKSFKITAIGTEALHTLRQLGHCTLCFKGGDTPECPGYIMLEGDRPAPEDIVKGGIIEIF